METFLGFLKKLVNSIFDSAFGRLGQKHIKYEKYLLNSGKSLYFPGIEDISQRQLIKFIIFVKYFTK